MAAIRRLRIARGVACAMMWCVVSPATGQTTGGSEPPVDPEREKLDELSRRLIEGRAGAEDVMARIIRLMGDIERNLSARLDAGAQTQSLQAEVVASLDQAIDQARQQMGRSNSGSSAAQRGGKRRWQQGGSRSTAGQPGSPDGDAADQTRRAEAPSTATGVKSGEFHEARRAWGHLPDRDREELIQGFQEDVVERYRDLIEQYYRALAEEEVP